MRNLVVVSVWALLLTVSASAQKVSGESEYTTDGKGHPSFSQYVFVDGQRWNGLMRYVVVDDGPHRGEFALGPTFHVSKSTVKLQFGVTTRRELMTAGVLVVPMRKSALVYIVDSKFSTTGKPHTVYQKFFVPLNTKGSWQLRAEDLQVGMHQAFLRIGGEYRQHLSEKVYAYFAPFGDPVSYAAGLNAGLRF